jgi:hypothetical protein
MAMTASTISESKPRLWIPFAGIIAGSIVLGTLFSLLTRGVSIPILTPAAIGFAGIFLLSYLIWQGRIRSQLLALGFAVLFAAVIYTTYHLVNYLDFMNRQTALIERSESVTHPQAQNEVNQALRATTGADGFNGYLRYRINTGEVLRKTLSFPESGNVVSGIKLIVFLWGLDFLVLLVLLGYAALEAVHRPYCTHCQASYGRIVIPFGSLGLVQLGHLLGLHANREFGEAIVDNDIERAGSLLRPRSTKGAGFNVYAESCPTCTTNPVGLVLFSSVDARTPVTTKNVSQEQYRELLAAAHRDAPTFEVVNLNQWLLLMEALMGFFIGVLFVAYLVLSSVF